VRHVLLLLLFASVAPAAFAGSLHARIEGPGPDGSTYTARSYSTWPKEGRWMIRFMLGHPPAPATVAALRADGSVESNKLYDKSDGSQECHKALRVKGEKVSEGDC